MRAAILGWALLGLVLCTVAYVGTRDPFPLQHEHPPHDSLGMAQQEGRGAYGEPELADRNMSAPKKDLGKLGDSYGASECRDAGGVPYWLESPSGEQYLTCHAGFVWGETH